MIAERKSGEALVEEIARAIFDNQPYPIPKLVLRDCARATLAVVRERERWQPIQTAPDDGTLVLLAFPYHPVASGRYEFGTWVYWPCLTEGGDSPTHWRPLPPPPEDRE